MRILVTGGAGFVGSHVIDKLLEQGHGVVCLDSGIAKVNNTPKGVTRLKTELVRANSAGWAFDAIVHCAARADVSRNWDSAVEREVLMRSNVLGTERLLEAWPNTPVVFLSTLAVYGDNHDCREDVACVATSPYAASKLAGEALVQAYAYRNGTPWHVLRLGCVVGSRYHHGHVADFVRMMRENGRIEARSNGFGSKSFVHVADVAEAVSLAVSGNIVNGIYNTAGGSWDPRSTVRTMGCEDKAHWAEEAHGWIGDPMALAGAQKLKAAGWFPRCAIVDGVKEALQGLGHE